MDVTPSLPLEEATMDVDGLEIYYRTGGSGAPLVLLSGFTQTGHLWDPFVGELGKEYALIVPDLPGHGRSAPFSGRFSHRKTAEAILALLDKLGLDSCRGMGLSSGATILLFMALQQPARVEAMVLISSAHRWMKKGRDAFRDTRWETISPEWRERLLRRHPGGEPQARALIDELRCMTDNYDDFDTSPEHLSTITARTLMAYGDRDRIDPVEEAVEAYRAIPDASLWVVPGHGHGVGMSDDPDGFLRVVRPFLREGWPA
jgi:pimeloyl-ACP methyl ester carboxylesterase